MPLYPAAGLQAMEDGIERALELTSTMQVLLDGVDTRLAEMERVVRPIHDVTDDLTRRYANLTETTALVEQYLAMFQVRNRCLKGRKKWGGGVLGVGATQLDHVGRGCACGRVGMVCVGLCIPADPTACAPHGLGRVGRPHRSCAVWWRRRRAVSAISRTWRPCTPWKR